MQSRKVVELSTQEVISILNELARDIREILECDLEISFTGGDPLLRKDIFKILNECKHLGIKTSILGNPQLLNDVVMARLLESGLSHYQLSLDGTRMIHDDFRGAGSFDLTIEKAQKLVRAGIHTGIMSTVSKANIATFPKLMEICAMIEVDSFAFDPFLPTGQGEGKREEVLSPEEYRSLLLSYLDKSRELKAQGAKTEFVRKGSLWALLYHELGMENELRELGFEEKGCLAGCPVGWGAITILPDGQVMACRRMPGEFLGRFGEQGFDEIFLSSPRADEFCQFERIKQCSSCELLNICRGCRARSRIASGDAFAADPLCWKK